MLSPRKLGAPTGDAYSPGPFSAFGRLLDVCTAVESQGMDVCSPMRAGQGCDDGVEAGSGLILMHDTVAPQARGGGGVGDGDGEEPVVVEPAPPRRRSSRAARGARGIELADLADGPYFVIVEFLAASSLGQVDAVSRLTRDLDRASGGPWQALGARAFHGLELDGEDLFEGDRRCSESSGGGGGEALAARQRLWPRSQSDWKLRYGRFRHEVKMFRSPFTGSEISAVEQADEIAYCRCKLRADVLHAGERGVYLEVEVHANSDNVSLAVVDFEGGGCSSVTFSPDTGAVIRERKVREAPRKVEGAYIQPLTTITSGQGFVGSMGLFLCAGHLAFFRRHSTSSSSSAAASEEAPGAAAVAPPPPAPAAATPVAAAVAAAAAPRTAMASGKVEAAELGPWESTGYVTDLSWAEGRQLTPCLAFRDVGTYQVNIAHVGAVPPVPAERTASAYDEASWRSLHWDAGEQDALEALEV